MIKYTIWDKERTLYPPVGEKFTPEKVYERWGWAENPACIVVVSEIDGVLQSFDNLGILKQNYGITESDPEKAVALIEEILNAPPAPIQEAVATTVSPVDMNEAIVARLDYLIMMKEEV